MVFVKDSDGRFLLVNQATANSLKISTESLTGQLHAQVHPNQAEVEAMLAADRQVIETGQPLFIPEEAYTDVDGQIRYLQTCKIPIQFIGHPKPAILGIAIDITDRKIAEIAIQQQAERERLITRITNHLRRSLDLQDILNTTVTEVRQILENDRVLIYRLLPDGGGVVIAESIAAGWQPILRQTITDPCLTEASCIQPYIQGHFQNTADIEQSGLSECYVQLLKQLQVRANLVLPILQGDQVWGWLVAQQCNAPRVWQPEEVTLLQQLSNQVAIAIQQSELYQQVQHLNTTLELQVQERTAQLQQSLDFEALLKRITDKVRDSLDENQILQTAVQELASRIGVGCCDTGIYNLEQGTSTIRYEYTRSLASSQGQVIQMADYEAIYRQLQQGEHLQFCKYHDHRGWMAVLVCPIQDNQETFGDLWLFDVPEKQFNEQEVRLVQQVTNQCAIALRQARLYQKAQSQVQELERLNQLKDDFLSTVSHELRSPMSNIKMSVQMLAMSLGIMDAEAQLTPTSIVDPVDLDFIKIAQYVQILDQECQQEISLINDLLDLARLEGETTPIMPIEISLQSWLLHVIEPFLERTRQHKQQLRVIVPADLPPLVTDMTSLERILTELMHNACKYTPPGEGIKISAHLLGEQKQHTHQAGRAVAVLPASLPPYFQIQICNSGIEISPVECDRIFDKFYRIPSNDPWRYGGTGLGLALVKKLVEHLGGSIWAEGANGQTCFTIVLPQSIHGTPFCGRQE
ncbi:hypothetical protein BST81_13145 [Leptolyngbya sp. 'hensonii']|nr:hypothetical protein BST81_13145 [Leptolyngbya sp. 'hensonii']